MDVSKSRKKLAAEVLQTARQPVKTRRAQLSAALDKSDETECEVSGEVDPEEVTVQEVERDALFNGCGV